MSGARHRRNVAVEFALTRRVTVVMVFMAVCVTGLIAFFRMPVQLFPAGFELPYMYVQIGYPNANPRESERDVLIPWEEQLGTVRGVRTIWAQAANNFAATFLEFEQGTNMRTAYNQVRDRIERLHARVPEGVGPINIWRLDPADDPVFWVGLRAKRPVDDVYELVKSRLARTLERIDGVSKVDVWGAGKRVLSVELDRDRMESHGVGLAEMRARLSRENFILSAGAVSDGGRRMLVRSVGRLASVEEFAALTVKPGVRLSDVADVRLAEEKVEEINRTDGQPGISLGIYKASDANTVELSRDVRAALTKAFAEDARLDVLDYKIIDDQGVEVKGAIDNLVQSAVFGGLIAGLILFFFLRNLALTIVISAMIPVSMLMTLGVLYFQGESLNVLTLMGFMLGVGMVVDNGIVVAEAVYQRRAEGMDALSAARKGAGEVGLAIVMSTLTTVVVFLPLILMTREGRFSFFLQKLGYPVCYALLASLVAALMFVPPATVAFLPKGELREPEFIAAMSRQYARVLRWALRHPAEVAIMLAAVVAISVPVVKAVKQGDPSQVGRIFRVHVNFPGNMNFEERDGYAREVEQLLLSEREKWRIQTVRARMDEGGQQLRLIVYLHLPKSGDMTTEAIIGEVRDRLPQRAGVSNQLGWRESTRRSQSSMTLSIYGEDTATLVSLAREVEKRLKVIPELTRVEAAPEAASSEEVRVAIGREGAARIGVTPLDLVATLGTAMRGARMRDFDDGGRAIEVWLRGNKTWRTDLNELLATPLPPSLLATGGGLFATSDGGAGAAMGSGTALQEALPGVAIAGAAERPPVALAARGGVMTGGVAMDESASATGLVTGATGATGVGGATGVTGAVGLPTLEEARQARGAYTVSNLADVTRGRSFEAILRKDRRTVLTVTLNTTAQDLDGLRGRIEGELKRMVWPRGYTYDTGERFVEAAEDSSSQMETAILAATFVFLLMGVLFESVLYPLAVIFSVPLAVLGAYWALWLTDTSFDVTCGVGIIVLIGVVVNNAIVLIDAVNRLRATGVGREAAILEAGRSRLRPILMTAATTIVGVVPMAVGEAAIFGVPYAPLGRVMIGGLVVSTLLTLVVVPLVYLLMDEASERMGRLFVALRGGSGV